MTAAGARAPQERAPRLLGIAGWSGAGKTTLILRLLPLLAARGLRVSTLKHVHHEVDLDRPGKDTFRHREAGAVEVMMVSRQRWALLHELRGADPPPLEDLIAHLSPVDLVLAEGFKTAPHAKIEVHRPALGKPALYPGDPAVVAVASDAALPDCPLPVLPLDAPEAIADFVCAWRQA